MNEQDKQLLLKVLCAMLPYGVKIFDKAFKEYKYSNVINIGNDYTILAETFDEDIQYFPKIDDIKIYLRPMSSMTEEEDLEFIGIGLSVVNYGTNGNAKHKCKLSIPEIDWLNANHFDYRGLIEKGLALEAPEEMYKV